jgi:hypothetical protein
MSAGAALGALLIVVGTLVFWTAVVALFRPLPKLKMSTRGAAIWGLILGVGLGIAGGAFSGSGEDSTQQTTTEVVAVKEAAPPSIPSVPKMPAYADVKPATLERQVTAAAMGADWPLMVEGGEIGCDDNGSAWIEPSGVEKRYALNGRAVQEYPRIDPIWAEDREYNEEFRRVTGSAMRDPKRRSMTALLQKALALC